MSLERFFIASFLPGAFRISVFTAIALAGAFSGVASLRASVTTSGDVSPAPPVGGGNVASIFRVGNTDVGSMTITNGTALTVTGVNGMFIGDGVDGVGIVNLTGFNSDLIVNSDIFVGDQGTATLTVEDFARVLVTDDTFMAASEGSFGEVFITGLGTVWDNGDGMAIGDRGRATVEITDGGRLLSVATDIGNNATGDGRVTVSGPLSLWRSTGPLQVGDFGRGRLQIFDQARVENTNVFVGSIANSVGAVEVDGEGSLWDTNGFMTIGSLGRGSLTITNKGRVTSNDARIGDNAGSLGDVVVDGFGSAWNITGVLLVSEPGEGYLTISDGGLVTATDVITVGARGQVTLVGGRLESAAVGGLVNQGVVEGSGTIHTATVHNSTAASEIRLLSGDQLVLTGTLTNAGSVDMQGGELEVLGTTTSTSDFDVRDGAVLRFHGGGLVNNNGARLAVTSGIADIFGAVDNNVGAQIIVGGEAAAVFHDAVTNDGQFFVQPGGEVLMLENLAFSAGATLTIQLEAVDLEEEGSDPSDGFGQVQVGGGAALTGTLAIELLGGYMPVAGDMFQILTAAGGLTGTFGTETLPALNGGLSWDVLYDSDSVTLAVIGAALAGDYNQNGIVDAADYTVWRDTLAQNVAPGTGADGNADGMINDEDYLIWKMNFGEVGAGAGVTSSSGDAPGAVPEPASICLAAVMATFSMIYRRS